MLVPGWALMLERPGSACCTVQGPVPAPGHRVAQVPGPHSSSCPCQPCINSAAHSSRALAFSLGSREGAGEGVVEGALQCWALAPPLSHTQWDRNKAGLEALKPRLHARWPRGGPDAWVPPGGLVLISGNPGVQLRPRAGERELGLGGTAG
jgi:hypothetical protein